MRVLTLFLLLSACPAPKDTSVDTGSASPFDTAGTDTDADGYPAWNDCDDTDPTVNPGAAERCDGIDNDCDGSVDTNAVDAQTWYPDTDGDGFGDPAGAVSDCVLPAGFLPDGTDCDDADPAVNPIAIEACNAVDDDCDGEVDESDGSLGRTWYLDADGDDWGDSMLTARACDIPDGYASEAGDCDDTDPSGDSYPVARRALRRNSLLVRSPRSSSSRDSSSRVSMTGIRWVRWGPLRFPRSEGGRGSPKRSRHSASARESVHCINGVSANWKGLSPVKGSWQSAHSHMAVSTMSTRSPRR